MFERITWLWWETELWGIRDPDDQIGDGSSCPDNRRLCPGCGSGEENWVGSGHLLRGKQTSYRLHVGRQEDKRNIRQQRSAGHE
jgi:hypothetical protein